MSNDYAFSFIMFIIGIIIGLFSMYTNLPIIENRHLNEVGIDHIEKCHNVHSNWSEIVWSKDVKKDGDK